jgi:hypothetical protein
MPTNKKETGLSTKLTDDMLAVLEDSFPTEPAFNRKMLPRIAFVSQDVTEGKGKTMKVVMEAGTFLIEKQDPEAKEVKGKNGKMQKPWVKEEIGTEIEAIILFERKQLKYYDSDNNKFTSSPVYDTDDQEVPLFCDGQEVDRGLPKDLQAQKKFAGLSAKGKPVSKLENNKILYVLYNNEMFQMNLRGSSMYAYLTYKRQNIPNTVLTKMSSEAKENGSIAWNQMTFEAVRPINTEEFKVVAEHLQDIKSGIEAEKAFFKASAPVEGKSKKDEDDDF